MNSPREPAPLDIDKATSPALSPPIAGDVASELQDRSLGDILRRVKNLSSAQIDAVVAHQREHGTRFGESIIALGLATEQDVLFALSQQFHYPYAPDSHKTLSDELVLASKPFSQQAEAFRAIRSQIIMRIYDADGPKPAVAVVSPNSGDGKTYFSANLAVALSQLGGRTLLVDADLRGPRQHKVFGLENTAGLSGILSGRVEGNVVQQVPDLPSLFVLPVGPIPPNPSELVERPAFNLLMRELAAKFDYVVVDTPAGVFGSDAHVIAARCGCALTVARKARTKVSDLQDFVALLSSGPVKLAGVVFNEY